MDNYYEKYSVLNMIKDESNDFIFKSAPLSGVLSAWYGHVPFAYWIVSALRPRRFVELGTHNGVSYAAFCDAVLRADLDTQCFAIDTWQGDAHAGYYGEDVYNDLRTFHDPRYAAFSELIRSTFDQALDYFQDGSIDLLHIDGCHSYEAVCHDFNNWRAKLSTRAVVLFHDTNVRERNFGVWKLWSELKIKYPNFEFMHEHGLGVLAFGSDVPEVVLKLCNLSSPSDIAVIRNRFAFSGRSCILEAMHVQAQRDISAAELRVTRTEAERRHLEERLAAFESHMTRMETERRDLAEKLGSVLSSESWRMTAPLRFLVRLIRRLTGRNLRRGRIILRALKPANIEHRREVIQVLRRRVVLASRFVPGLNNAVIHASRITLPSISDDYNLKSLKHIPPHHAAVVSYPIWSLRFDTPSATDLLHLEETEIKMPEILVIARFSSETFHLIQQTANALKTTVGVRWRSVFITKNPDDTTFAVTCMQAFQGDVRFLTRSYPEELNGKIIVLLEAGAIPRSHGIRLLVEAMVHNPDLALTYSDEDRLSSEGLPEFPWFKPKYSPLLAAQGMLFGRMFAIRPCGQLASDSLFDPTQSVLQLALKATHGLASERIRHIAHVLFHDILPPAPLQPVSLPSLEILPFVSIFIPTRDHWHLLRQCLESLRRTDWPIDRIEIIVIDNGSTETETLEGMAIEEASGRIRIIRDGRKFNYAALNNVAARAARGDVFVLLNNDTEIIDPTWLRKLCAYAIQPEVGAVGAKLLYEDRTIQHGGVILGIQGTAGHAHLLLRQSEGGYQQLANITREVAAVTGACIAVSRTAFEEVGGLREEFEVAFNDVVFCLDLLAAGRRNIYVHDCVLIHHESKTRGFDTTPQKIAVARSEAIRAWLHHPRLLRDDPYYSPNLSLESPYKLAFAPRRRELWRKTVGATLKILMLSSTYARGHGVAVVIDLMVTTLRKRGHVVFLAGTKSDRDFSYGGTEVIDVQDPRSAATMAADLQIDVIIAHTPPFFGVARWTGAYPPVIAYDYGEPPPNFFPDEEARREILAEKNASLLMCTKVFAISQAISDESLIPPDKVIPLGNSHLGVWTSELLERREAIRRKHGWTSHYVILNVCRFHVGERKYKGVDQYADMLAALKSVDPDFAARCIFVLCGKADEEDIAAVRAQGITAIANISDEEMLDLYVAADFYVNFSRWEGYNLGIGQALAMGLKVIASDIPAHRAFGVRVVGNTVDAAFALLDLTRESTERVPRLWSWDEPLQLFAEEIENLAFDSINSK